MSGTRRFASDDVRQASQGYWQQRSFNHEVATPLRRILVGFGIMLCIVFTAVLGYVIAGWSWLDALYMVVITVSGVGYGEVKPVETYSLRWLTILLIVLGYAAAIYTVGGFAQMVIDGELRRVLGVRRMHKEIDRLDQHVVICGFGRMGKQLAESLARRGKPLVVVDRSAARVAKAREFGCLAIEGNATEEGTLKSAGIERAGSLTTCLSDDVANLFITITAHDLNPDLTILARAEQPSTVKKLRQVGASKVILPASIGADRLANMILRPSAETLLAQAQLPQGLNDDLASIGLRLDELEIQDGSSLIGGTIDDLKIHGTTPFLIVALRNAAGEVVLNPASSQSLALGDCVVILAHDDDIPELCARYALQSELDEDSMSEA